MNRQSHPPDILSQDKLLHFLYKVTNFSHTPIVRQEHNTNYSNVPRLE